MPTQAAPVDQLGRALDATGDLIAGVRDDQWSNPTPCPDWNVRALVNHLVFGHRMFTGIIRGDQPPAPEDLAELRASDHLGDDPLKAYRDGAAALQAAFNQPNALERVVQAPIGTVPGAAVLQMRITEALVHGWDLAHATGQPARLPDDLAEESLGFAQRQLGADVSRAGRFGEPQAVAADAPAIDRLAAHLGRVMPRMVAD
jgi:uncharacterized protein (TIGR03086 family)